MKIGRHGSCRGRVLVVDEVGADVGQHPAVAAELDPIAREADGAHATDRAEVGRVGVRIGERHARRPARVARRARPVSRARRARRHASPRPGRTGPRPRR